MNDFELIVNLSNKKAINNDYEKVFKDILVEYKNLIPTGPPLGYKRLNIQSGQGPVCVINFLPDYYLIYLNFEVDSRYYNQAALQFAHELCHIYCNPHIDNRLIESICAMSSYYFLEHLNIVWQKNPPFPHWKEYASVFLDYKSKNIGKINLNLGEYSDIKNALEPFKEPYTSDNERNLQNITAKELLPLFQKSKNAWLLLQEFEKFFHSNDQPKIQFKKLSESIKSCDERWVTFKSIEKILIAS